MAPPAIIYGVRRRFMIVNLCTLVAFLAVVIPTSTAGPTAPLPPMSVSSPQEHIDKRRLQDAAIQTTNTNNTNNEEPPRKRYRFAVVAKNSENVFFLPVKHGCDDKAVRLSTGTDGDNNKNNNLMPLVECHFVGPTQAEASPDGLVQGAIVTALFWPDEALAAGSSNNSTGDNSTTTTRQQLVSPPIISGLAISIENETIMAPILKRIRNEFPRIPVITFDGDFTATPSDLARHPELTDRVDLRQYYVGTNNTFLGAQLGRAMETLQPGGGTFGIITGSAPNLQARAQGVLEELFHVDSTGHEHAVTNNLWTPLPGSPFDARGNVTGAIEQMEYWAKLKPTVIVSVMGLPMRTLTSPNTNQSYSPWKQFVDSNPDHRNITLLCGDAMDHQLSFLQSNYVHGLVGQLPFEMGSKSLEILHALATDNLTNTDANYLGDPISDEIQDRDTKKDCIGTNVISHVFVPLRLPPIQVDHNLIGNLKYVGYSLFGVIAFMSISFGVWAWLHRNVRVVRVAQPRFLIMIAVGCLIMASSMIPLSMDDGGGSSSHCTDDGMGFGEHCVAICMSVPWCNSIGFTIAFSALYSKTRRVTKIFHSDSAFGRIEVSYGDVLKPFFFLLSLNVVILLCWTIIDPLTYTRVADGGRDGWNRVISTHGECTSENMAYYLIPLTIVNCSILILANWQAYEARDIEAEFAETKYIGICMGSLLQAGITGVPVLFIVKDNPPAYYLVATLLIFIICVVLLAAIFLPKIIFTREYLKMSDRSQKKFMADVIGKTTKASHQRLTPSAMESNTLSPSPSRPFGRFSSLSLKWNRKKSQSPVSSLGTQSNPEQLHVPPAEISSLAMQSDPASSSSNTSGIAAARNSAISPFLASDEGFSAESAGMAFVRKSVLRRPPQDLHFGDRQMSGSGGSGNISRKPRVSAVRFAMDVQHDVIEEGESEDRSTPNEMPLVEAVMEEESLSNENDLSHNEMPPVEAAMEEETFNHEKEVVLDHKLSVAQLDNQNGMEEP